MTTYAELKEKPTTDWHKELSQKDIDWPKLKHLSSYWVTLRHWCLFGHQGTKVQINNQKLNICKQLKQQRQAQIAPMQC